MAFFDSGRFALRCAVWGTALVTMICAGPHTAGAAEPIPVVASFSILGDMTARIGGDRVHIKTLVGPDGDAHVYQPTPQDAQQIAKAQLVVVNGLGFEGWMARLLEAAGYRGVVVTAAAGIAPLSLVHDGHTEADPHAFQNLRNGLVYVANIEAGLCQIDPAGCSAYKANAAAYSAEISDLDAEVRRALQDIPAERRKVITAHDAFGYFSAAYGVSFLAPQGLSTDAEASAYDVAQLIQQIRATGTRALFIESMTDPRLIEQIGKETGVTPGGTLYADALSGGDGPAPTYLALFRHNLAQLTAALNSRP